MESLVKTKGIVATFMLVLPLFCGSSICAADGFDSVRCGSDVRKALLGRKMSNERIVVLQERHKDLGLKDLGGTEISDRIFLISWQICGEEYVLPGTAIGVLKDEAGVELLPATTAWKIDDKQVKFVKLQTEGLRCSRDGINTSDGGL